MNAERFDGHTPGPWYLDDAPDVKHPSVVLADDGATIVAEAMTVVAEQHDAEANARLIAAAPDLLAEVKRLRDLHILACDYLQDISNGTLPDSEWPHIRAMIRGEEE